MRSSSTAQDFKRGGGIRRDEVPNPVLSHEQEQEFELPCPSSDLQFDNLGMPASHLYPGLQRQVDDSIRIDQVADKDSLQGDHQRSTAASRMSEDQRIRVQNLLKERKIQLGLKSAEGT